MILDRIVEQPIMIEVIDGGESIMSGIPVHVAIVPVDSSGNAHRDLLNVGSGKAIDNSGDDPGGHLPDVDFTVQWGEDGGAIEIEWQEIARTDIRSYRIYVSDARFENTDEANMAKGGIIGTFWSLEEFNETLAYDNSTHWFIAVSAYDGNVWKHLVQAKELKPYKAPSDGDGGGTNDGEASAGLFDLIDMNTLLTILLSLAIVTVLLLVIRGRSNRSKNDALELAHAAWGLPKEEGWEDNEDGDVSRGPDADLAETLIPAASQIQASKESSVSSTPQETQSGFAQQTEAPPTDASRRLAELSDDLFGDTASSSSSSGDSELDTLIDDLL
jgi:hypothetical protein